MPVLEKKNETAQPMLDYGWVVCREDRNFTVQTPFGRLRAERAVGCLVQPNPGDMTLLSVDEDGLCFILSVLRRAESSPVRTDLVFEGQVHLHATEQVAITSGGRLDLGADQEISCVSSGFSLLADEAKVTFQKLSCLGTTLKSKIKRLKCVAGDVEQIFRQLTQRLENSCRYVKEHDEVQTGSSRHLVEDTYAVHAKNAVHMAEEMIKLNAEQIHLG